MPDWGWATATLSILTTRTGPATSAGLLGARPVNGMTGGGGGAVAAVAGAPAVVEGLVAAARLTAVVPVPHAATASTTTAAVAISRSRDRTRANGATSLVRGVIQRRKRRLWAVRILTSTRQRPGDGRVQPSQVMS